MSHTSHVEFVLSTRQELIRIKKFQFFWILLAYDTYLTIFICHAYLKKKRKKFHALPTRDAIKHPARKSTDRPQIRFIFERAPVIPRRVTLGKVESIPRSNGNDKLKWKKKKKKKREKKSRFARYSAIMIVRRAPPRHPQRHPCYSSVTSLKVHNGRLFASRLCIVVVNTCRRFYQGRWRRPEKVVEEEESRTSLPQKGVIFP